MFFTYVKYVFPYVRDIFYFFCSAWLHSVRRCNRSNPFLNAFQFCRKSTLQQFVTILKGVVLNYLGHISHSYLLVEVFPPLTFRMWLNISFSDWYNCVFSLQWPSGFCPVSGKPFSFYLFFKCCVFQLVSNMPKLKNCLHISSKFPLQIASIDASISVFKFAHSCLLSPRSLESFRVLWFIYPLFSTFFFIGVTLLSADLSASKKFA